MAYTFGEALRAYRLGYREVPRWKAWMKISEGLRDETYLITLVPYGTLIPDTRGNKKNKLHWCWWKGKDVDGMLSDMKPLRGVKKVKKVLTFELGDDGELIKKGHHP